MKYAKINAVPRVNDPILNKALQGLDDELSKIARVLNVADFKGLVDTPSSYAGEGGKNVKVKVAEDGLEFVSPGAPEVHATEHEVGGSDLLDFTNITGFGTYLNQAVLTSSYVNFNRIRFAPTNYTWIRNYTAQYEAGLHFGTRYPVVWQLVSTGALEFIDQAGTPIFAIKGNGETWQAGALNLLNTSKINYGDRAIIAGFSSSPNRGANYYARGNTSGWYGVHRFYTEVNNGANILTMTLKNGNVILSSANSTITGGTELHIEAGSSGISSATIYNDTTGYAANMHVIATDQTLRRSTSGLKHKKEVTNLELDSSRIYDLKPCSFTSRSPVDKNKRFVGLIADEVGEVFPDIVIYNESGEAENYDNQMLMTLMLAEIQNLNQKTEALEARFNN